MIAQDIDTFEFAPGFRAALYAKDYRIAAATLAEHGVPAPVSTAVKALVDALVESGRGDDDYSAVAKVVAEAAGV